jgi:hypothetical protein
LNLTRIGTYERLMEAQDAVAKALYGRGVSDRAIAAALDECEPADTTGVHDVDLYLGVLARYVELLGGRLELQAVFAEAEVRLLAEFQG